MAKTATPTGLTIARNGMGMTCGWKIAAPDHGAGQQMQWRTSLTKTWTSVTIGKAVTSKKISLQAANYHPTTTKKPTAFYFRVRGKRAATTDSKTKKKTTYTWSAWKECSFSLTVPDRPTLTATLSGTNSNVCSFAWAVVASTTDHKPFVDVQWQTILVKECAETDGSKLTWKNTVLGWGAGTGAASGSITRTENTDLLAAASYTRWVRVCSRGAAGASAWRYAKHVYAAPYAASIKAASAAKKANATQMDVSVKWELKTGAAHPVDRVDVQWRIDKPTTGRNVPAGGNWTTGYTVADTDKTDTVKFTVDNAPGTDQCMWVRVVSVHDSNSTYSAARLVASGSLAAPTNLSVDGTNTTGRAVITATNNSDVPDAHLAVVHRKSGMTDYICGIIPHGSSTVTVQVPTWTGTKPASFGVYAFQGSYTSSQRAGGQTQYAVTANMRSDALWDGGNVPKAPSDVAAAVSDTPGEVIVTWTWSWQEADRAEVSWSQNPNAWESTDEPEAYLLDNTHAAKLRVGGLEMGAVWYIRVRLAQVADNDLVYGPYSSTVMANLSTAPNKPVLALSAGVVPEQTQITATWSYDATDGTDQSYAEIWTATVDGDTVTPVARLVSTTTARSASITANWETGTTVNLIARVTSGSGLQSEWSDPASISVADPPTCEITASSLVPVEIEDDDGTTRTVAALTVMPLTVTVTGAGAGGITSVAIERAELYQMDRPDESVFNGYAGETIYTFSHAGEVQITVDQTALVGMLDDGAAYRLVATTQDGLGQVATASQDFTVLWSHQAIMPEATVAMDPAALIAIITPVAPELTQEGDVVDIYRLSADRPELIVEGGAWGTRYVDPYPTLGELGGHRVVYRTVNGDYITADNHPAWIDLGSEDGDHLAVQDAIIDFDGGRVQLPYNLELSSSWAKDFQETQYLGGSVQGDWNPAVSRTGSIGSVVLVLEDLETIQGLRRLATYAGVCHVRTPDGSSFAADVQVSESREIGMGSKLARFTLSFTRVDPEGLDGMTYEEWLPEEES